MLRYSHVKILTAVMKPPILLVLRGEAASWSTISLLRHCIHLDALMMKVHKFSSDIKFLENDTGFSSTLISSSFSSSAFLHFLAFAFPPTPPAILLIRTLSSPISFPVFYHQFTRKGKNAAASSCRHPITTPPFVPVAIILLLLHLLLFPLLPLPRDPPCSSLPWGLGQ